MTRTQLINLLILNHGFKSYLEIGCQNNVNYDKIKCDRKISVDPDQKAGATFQCTSDDFFKSCLDSFLPILKPEKISDDEAEYIRKKVTEAYCGKNLSLLTTEPSIEIIEPPQKFDIIFIDGLHHADQVERDTINSMACLNPGGIIVLHDCNPPTEKDQLVPRRHKVWYGDVWRAFVGFRSKYPNVKSYCIEDDCGCGVIHYTCQNIEPGFITEMSWEEFDKSRKELLGLL